MWKIAYKCWNFYKNFPTYIIETKGEKISHIILTNESLFHIVYGHILKEELKSKKSKLKVDNFEYTYKNIIYDLDMVFKYIDRYNEKYILNSQDGTNYRVRISINDEYYMVFLKKLDNKIMSVETYYQDVNIRTYVLKNNLDSLQLKHNLTWYIKKN